VVDAQRQFDTAPIKSFAELVAAGTSAVQTTLEKEIAVVDGIESQPYKDRMLNRDKLRLLLSLEAFPRRPRARRLAFPWAPNSSASILRRQSSLLMLTPSSRRASIASCR
jgi:hypothetical protein